MCDMKMNNVSIRKFNNFIAEHRLFGNSHKAIGMIIRECGYTDAYTAIYAYKQLFITIRIRVNA